MTKLNKSEGFVERRRGFFLRTLHFLFSWKSMSTPWCKIPGLMRWWWSGTEDKKYRTAASPVVFTLLAVLLAGPLLTGYPAVWISTYFYNYYSVIYPKDIPQDKEKERGQ